MDEEEVKQKTPLKEDIKILEEHIRELKKYNTWTYDFPEVMKILGSFILAIIPIVFPLIFQFLGLV